MPALFWTAIILAIFGLIILGFSLAMKRSQDRETSDAGKVGIGIAGFLVFLAVLFTVGASANSVPVRNVGIVTSFNKPTGEVTGSGLQWVKPWEKVRDWDASRQYYDHIGDDKRIRVRTATLADAWVHVLVEYQTSADAAPEQFQNYKQDFNLFKNKIGVQLDNIVNRAFTTYNPLLNIDVKTGDLNVDLKPFADEILRLAENELGDEVEFISISLPRVDHDKVTEENIKKFQDEISKGRVLDQEKINAEKRKEVTETNAEVDDIVRCLEIAEKNGSNPGWCLNPGMALAGK